MLRLALTSMIRLKVFGALLLGRGIWQLIDRPHWDASHAFWAPEDRDFYLHWLVAAPIALGAALLALSMILPVAWPRRFAGDRPVKLTPAELEAQRRIDAANARILTAPAVDAPRARLPGERTPELARPLPSPPRIGDDPFRSPPQRIIVPQAAPSNTATPKIVPAAAVEDPKRLR